MQKWEKNSKMGFAKHGLVNDGDKTKHGLVNDGDKTKNWSCK